MKNLPFGWTREPVSVVGQGTWGLEKSPRGEAIRALRAGLDAGMTMIDTAEMYGSGEVETTVGEAIRTRRDEVFLVTKVLPSNATRKGTIAACERSLARLGTDRIDLYLYHWPGSHPLEDAIAAFEELQQKGKIRFWGLSNFDVPALERALALAGPRGNACDQVLLHLEERGVEHAVLPWCDEHHVPLMAYSPFGSGHFPSPKSVGGEVLAAIAAARRATPRQIALAFMLRDPIVFVIPKAGSAAHAVENAGAAEIELTDEEIEAIDRAFPIGERPSRLPTL
jgi:diketogulonate reductase-like aldo/keto reductase